MWHKIYKGKGRFVVIPDHRLEVKITDITNETATIKRFTFEGLDNKALPAFSPGSHIILYLKGRGGEMERRYSLIGSPDSTDNYQIAVKLHEKSSGGSIYLHSKAQIGDNLQISFPKNYFPLSFRARHHLLIAAGIGITPFLSMMRELKDQGASFELHYSSKTKEDCAFYSYLSKEYRQHAHFYFTKHENRIDTNILVKQFIGTHIYLCGPEGFTSSFSCAATSIGYPSASIHYEYFSPPNIHKPLPFILELTNGRFLSVPEEKSTLEVLLEAGYPIPHSCKVGRCGTCELSILEGEAEHYDSFLSTKQKESQACFLPCVSRSKTDTLKVEYR
ncbi:oxidoreductase [Sutcliffiella horikoshii]|uniref:Oxidoreductase n=1 Tax=Sutcliffiella horikoshii TaxID=79883 RepID=A0A5D4T4X1_9BACI|nr:PDR/VanB family oxidoreductase [Sutcliffiella horikoshii]TYS69532.1 oxidoreductase [Sutcliffiella horikoshii]